MQAALTPRDDVSDDSTPVRHLPEAGDMTVVRAPVPRPESAHAHLLRAPDSDEDDMALSRFSQAQRSKANASLLMTQPPSVARVMPLRMSQPNINPTSSDVTSEHHESSDEQIALDVDEVDDDDVIARPPREVTRSNAPSSLFGKSSRDVSTSQPISGSNAASVSNTAFLRKIYEANVGTPSPATMRTVSEINDVIKSQQAVKGPSPWHSRSTSGASSVSGNDATPAGSLSARELSTRGAEDASTPTMTSLGRSASSNSLDETPVKEERRSRVELNQIRLSSPAPPPTSTTSGVGTTESWRHRNSITAEARSVQRRREGEPEDERSSASILFSSSTSTSATTTTTDSTSTNSLSVTSGYRAFARPRSSLDSGVAGSVSDKLASASRFEQAQSLQSEGRGRVGTLLSRNKEILTNLLPTQRSAAEMTSSSPQVPRRSRSGSSSSSNPSSAAINNKLQWLKPNLPQKHPLDVTSPTSPQPPPVTSSSVVISVSPAAAATMPSSSTFTSAQSLFSASSSSPRSSVTSASDEPNVPRVTEHLQQPTSPRGSLGSERSAFRSPRTSLTSLPENRQPTYVCIANVS